MKNESFSILPVDLHWMSSINPEEDLCAHGGIKIMLGEKCIIDTGPEDYALSTGAVFLLRTIGLGHTPEKQIGEHLIPHCGHLMFMNENSGFLDAIGCSIGVNWWVRYGSNDVTLEFISEQKLKLSIDDWCQAVKRFSEEVSLFYFQAWPKTSTDDSDQEWLRIFIDEWQRRSSEIRCVS
jgi:hypothetical protein